MKKHSLISLFSGCGGFDLGFIQEGFYCLGAYDIDPVALDVHSINLKSKTFMRDLSEATYQFHDSKTVDVVIAGSPCQGFSTLGKRRFNDSRNTLMLHAGELASVLKPRVFVLENVMGAVSGKHKKYWLKLHTILRNSGYRTTDIVCNGIDMGVAQTRRRIMVIAWKNNDISNFPMPPLSPAGDLRATIRNISNTKNHNINRIPSNTTHDLIAQKIKPGQKLSNVRGGIRSIHTWHIPEVFGVTTAEERKALETVMRLRRQYRRRSFGDADPLSKELLFETIGQSLFKSLLAKGYVCEKEKNLFDLTHTFNGKYRRLAWDKPSCTVDTRFGDYRFFLHPNKNRGFSVREAARIQGFPDSFVFKGSLSDQYRMVGNAVPPPMARSIARIVKILLRDDM